MIVIIGASGAVGVPTIRHLVKRDAAVRALTSNEGSAERLTEIGVAEAVVGDFRSDGDVGRVVDGARAVYYIPPRFTEDEDAIGRRVIAASRKAGIGHFVFSSAYHPQVRSLNHHWRKLLVEEAVIESGLDFTILQPSMFMQNARVEWPRIVADGVYSRPYSPHQRMSLIDTEDLGEASAIVLTEPGYAGATFELCGPDSLTQAEMAAILGETLGRPVRAEHRDPDEWEAWARGHGWADYSIETYRKMCAHYDAHGYSGGNPLVLRTILGRDPTGYRAFAERFIAEQQAG